MLLLICDQFNGSNMLCLDSQMAGLSNPRALSKQAEHLNKEMPEVVFMAVNVRSNTHWVAVAVVVQGEDAGSYFVMEDYDNRAREEAVTTLLIILSALAAQEPDGGLLRPVVRKWHKWHKGLNLTRLSRILSIPPVRQPQDDKQSCGVIAIGTAARIGYLLAKVGEVMDKDLHMGFTVEDSKTMRGEIVQAVLKTSVPPRVDQGSSSSSSSSLQPLNDESPHYFMLVQSEEVHMQMAREASLNDDARSEAHIRRLMQRLAIYDLDVDLTTPDDGSCLFWSMDRGLPLFGIACDFVVSASTLRSKAVDWITNAVNRGDQYSGPSPNGSWGGSVRAFIEEIMIPQVNANDRLADLREGDVDAYLAYMRQSRSWADQLVLTALATTLDICIRIVSSIDEEAGAVRIINPTDARINRVVVVAHHHEITVYMAVIQSTGGPAAGTGASPVAAAKKAPPTAPPPPPPLSPPPDELMVMMVMTFMTTWMTLTMVTMKCRTARTMMTLGTRFCLNCGTLLNANSVKTILKTPLCLHVGTGLVTLALS